MNEIMRFLVKVDTAWKVTFSLEGQGGWSAERQLGKLPLEPDLQKGQFPLPLEKPQSTEPGYALCTSDKIDALWDVYDKIVTRNVDRDSVKQFGSFLFHTLIGSEIWASILNACKEEEWIELALSWRKGEHYLHRLNWEMMHGPNGFLASGYPKKVAITRQVAGEPKSVRLEPRKIQPPPKMLFVIGAPLTDPNIRPGAEYYGLLRQLRSEKRSIHTWVVHGAKAEKGATPAEVGKAIKSFMPDVVHFICHGNFDGKRGEGYLELEPNQGETDKKCFTREILGLLAAGGTYPPIVVLSACYSGGIPKMFNTGDLAPLAANLIAGGVPVVIGMGGRVSDRACRLFTRQFGLALVEGKPLATAVAQGRLAAFAESPLPEAVDWAFPTVFMAEEIPSGYIHVDVRDTDPARVIEERIGARGYKLMSEPVFCGREEFFKAYYDLFHPGEREQPVLMIHTQGADAGLGRRRLLQEFAAQAIRDGHVPCLVSPPGPDQPVATTGVQLAIGILKAIGDARKVFELRWPPESAVFKFLEAGKPIRTLQILRENLKNDPELLFKQVLQHYGKLKKEEYADLDEAIGLGTIRTALERDLKELIEDAREKYPRKEDAIYPVVKDTNRVLVLLEKVDQYGERLQSALLGDEMLGAKGSVGFGTPGEPVPVVLAFSVTQQNKVFFDAVKETKTGWVKLLELKPFQQNGEDLLAYERVLLYPNTIKPGISDVAWAVNGQAPPKTIEACQVMLRDNLEGIPVKVKDGIYSLVRGFKGIDYLVEANDEKVLEDYLNRLKTGGLPGS